MGSFGTEQDKSKSRGSSASTSRGVSSGASSGSSTSKSSSQRSALDDFIASQSGAIGRGVDSFEGNRVAGFSDLQNLALSMAPGALFRSPEQERDIFNDRVDLFENSVVAPAERRFRQETVPLINEQFAGPGFFGSARAQESVRAGEDLASNISAQRAELSRGLREETEAINRQGVGSLFDFGQQQQRQEQREIDADMQRFMESTAITNPEDAALLAQLLGIDVSGSISSSISSSIAESSSESKDRTNSSGDSNKLSVLQPQ